jgi:hypothetical protein
MSRFSYRALVAAARNRPTGYLAAVLELARPDGEHLVLDPAAHAELKARFVGPAKSPWPRLARWIARRRQPGDRGVGDTLARILAPLGGDTFKRWTQRIGAECGCAARQAELNRRFPYVDAAGVLNGPVRPLY